MFLLVLLGLKILFVNFVRKYFSGCKYFLVLNNGYWRIEIIIVIVYVKGIERW